MKGVRKNNRRERDWRRCDLRNTTPTVGMELRAGDSLNGALAYNFKRKCVAAAAEEPQLPSQRVRIQQGRQLS
ncbi:unnamed protein product [Linum trigynum]|uniref:Uncharacterized protein n=1 Tax=Linum trigynum TaxID=586398 RepID=A0AAV2EUM8_9ROSI